MKRLGYQFLSGAGTALNEDRGVHIAYFQNSLLQLFHGRVAGDDVVHGVIFGTPAAGTGVVLYVDELLFIIITHQLQSQGGAHQLPFVKEGIDAGKTGDRVAFIGQGVLLKIYHRASSLQHAVGFAVLFVRGWKNLKKMFSDDVIGGEAVSVRIGDFTVAADTVRIKDGHFVEKILRREDAGRKVFVHIWAPL